ncbi:hypothetical protein C8Q75DRAFT_154311 [Abortiporus biennis]|nr:hypothetical protein C8Q75DRAFT_154311 [Abortiporus biennis]
MPQLTFTKLRHILNRKLVTRKKNFAPTTMSEITAGPNVFVRIPSEIWYIVAQYLTLEKDETITSLALTCHGSRWLFQPILFNTISIHQYQRVTFHSVFYVQSPAYVERLHQRLEFMSNERLRWALRSIRLNVYHSCPSECTVAGSHSTDILPAGITSFTGLRSIHMDRGEITLPDLQRLSTLPSLEFLSLKSCYSKLHNCVDSTNGDDMGGLELKLKELDCMFHVDIHENPIFWSIILNSNTLESLSIRITNAVHHLLDTVLCKGIWYRLRHLHILLVRDSEARQMIEVLSVLPNLESLTMPTGQVDWSMVPTHAVPKLTSMTSNIKQIMDCLSQNRPLRQIEIITILDDQSYHNLILRSNPRTISLDIVMIVSEQTSFLTDTFSMLGNLKELETFHVSCPQSSFRNGPGINVLSKYLRESPLPQSLLSLSIIRIDNPHGRVKKESPTHLVNLGKALREKCPNMYQLNLISSLQSDSVIWNQRADFPGHA